MRCSFERLIECLDGRLDTEGQLEVFSHVERCDVCFEAMFELVRERNMTGYDRGPAGAATGAPPRPEDRNGGTRRRTLPRSESPSACKRRPRRVLSTRSRASNCRASAKSG